METGRLWAVNSNAGGFAGRAGAAALDVAPSAIAPPWRCRRPGLTRCRRPSRMQPRERLAEPVGHGGDEARVVVPDAQLVDVRRTVKVRDRVVEIFAVLAASAVGTEGAGDVGDGAADAVRGHPGEGVAQHGMPVPIAPVHRQAGPGGRQFPLKRRDELARVPVDRADAAEAVVAPGDARLDGGRYGQAGEDIVQEGHDIVGTLGAAEGDDQDGVVMLGGVVVEGHGGVVPTIGVVGCEWSTLARLISPAIHGGLKSALGAPGRPWPRAEHTTRARVLHSHPRCLAWWVEESEIMRLI